MSTFQIFPNFGRGGPLENQIFPKFKIVHIILKADQENYGLFHFL